MQRLYCIDNLHEVSLLYVISYVIADDCDLKCFTTLITFIRFLSCMCTFKIMEITKLWSLYHIDYIHEVSFQYGIFYFLETGGTCKDFIATLLTFRRLLSKMGWFFYLFEIITLWKGFYHIGYIKISLHYVFFFWSLLTSPSWRVFPHW